MAIGPIFRPGSKCDACWIAKRCAEAVASLQQLTTRPGAGEGLHHVRTDDLGWWLAERQTPGGGLNGRPEKLPDVCYSWWILSALAIMRRLNWIDRTLLPRSRLERVCTLAPPGSSPESRHAPDAAWRKCDMRRAALWGHGSMSRQSRMISLHCPPKLLAQESI